MFQCKTCKREFKHQSAYSRHVRGNPNQKVRPCVQRIREPVLYDHFQGEKYCIPDIAKNIMPKGVNAEFVPALWLEKIHMNEEHPSYWNVVLANISSQNILIRSHGGWAYKSFLEWFHVFSKEVIGWYHNNVTPLDANSIVNIVFDTKSEMRKKCCKHVLNVLSNHMRNVIKKHHNLR